MLIYYLEGKNMAFEEYWNDSHKKYFEGKIIYDNWLDKYKNKISNCKTKILDLGCGEGNDTLYLKERGYEVISLDYSVYALNIVKKYIKNSITVLADISDNLPFEDDSFDIIIADLSLHYFDLKTTNRIMKEIKRILKKNGCLLARVNSKDDFNFGCNQGFKIEEDYYHVFGYNKRFFNEKSAMEIFSQIGETKVSKANMLRYSKPKKVLEVISMKNE